MVPKIKNIHRRLVAPMLVIGVRRQFCRVRSTAPLGQAKGLANLDSDPNNQLPPEGANFPWGGPVENFMARFLVASKKHHDCP